MKVAVLNLLLLVLLLQAGVYNAAPSIYTQVLNSNLRRPAEFNAVLERHKRESSGRCPTNLWHDDGSNCPSMETNMRFDELHRRQSGLLSTVESQGTCGSCWAFASSSTFTDCRNIAAGQITPPLSPQYLTTCIRNASYVDNGNGCCGGYIEYAAFYLMSVGTTTAMCLPYDLEEYFPYIFSLNNVLRRIYKYRRPLTCSDTCSSGMDYDPGSFRLAGYRMLKTEEDILAAVRTGPVVTTMESSLLFQSYECGVFCLDDMRNSTPNHAVEIVDYGTTDGIDFYVVKNSWGEDWGEGGYFRIRRGDLGVGLNAIQFVISPSGAPQQDLNFFILPPTSSLTCAAEEMPNSSTNEVIIMVANFAIEELNKLQLILCPDNATIAGPITLSSVVNATSQTVAGIFFNVTMKAQVGGCRCDINARISAMVFVDLDGNFNLTSYTYSSGAGTYASIILLFVIAVFNFLLITCY